MGLCKCRTVTNLFCFEHRKNVCEKCILSDHQRCIVRSYLQWLQDSDYEPACGVCQTNLDRGQVVRLTCLDLFHIECLNTQCASLPPNTTHHGYACPTCQTPIIPPDSMQTPLADTVRATFMTAPWAQRVNSISVSSSFVNNPVISSVNAYTQNKSSVNDVSSHPPISGLALASKSSPSSHQLHQQHQNQNLTAPTSSSSSSSMTISIPIMDDPKAPLLNAASSIVNTPKRKESSRWWAGEMRDGDDDKYGKKPNSAIPGSDIGGLVNYIKVHPMQAKRFLALVVVGLIAFMLITSVFLREEGAPVADPPNSS